MDTKHVSFTLELYFACDEDRGFAEGEARKLRQLVSELAPHVALDIRVLRATKTSRHTFPAGAHPEVPCHEPSCGNHQSLLITHEDIGAEGRGWPGMGCLNRRLMEGKAGRGGSSADITVHEWLHALEGQVMNGRAMPSPDANATHGFPDASGRGADGIETWHEWYRHLLRW